MIHHMFKWKDQNNILKFQGPVLTKLSPNMVISGRVDYEGCPWSDLPLIFVYLLFQMCVLNFSGTLKSGFWVEMMFAFLGESWLVVGIHLLLYCWALFSSTSVKTLFSCVQLISTFPSQGRFESKGTLVLGSRGTGFRFLIQGSWRNQRPKQK